MVDSRPLMEQVEELTNLLHEIHAEGMRICETFQVACVIEKLPLGWTDFKNYLKLKRKWMSLEDLIVRLRIESTNRRQIGVGVQILEPNANMVEHQNNNQGNGQHKGKGKITPQNSQKFKKKSGENSSKFTGTCHKCGKTGHKSFECYRKKASKKNDGKNEANLTEEDMCA